MNIEYDNNNTNNAITNNVGVYHFVMKSVSWGSFYPPHARMIRQVGFLTLFYVLYVPMRYLSKPHPLCP